MEQNTAASIPAENRQMPSSQTASDAGGAVQTAQRQLTQPVGARTRWSFGLGCIGRDAAYTLVSNFIMTYLTLAVGLSNWELMAVGVVMVLARVWDAANDPMMGTIIDNMHTRFGKFKPYILSGALLNSIFIVLLFCDFGLKNGLFVLVFAITYVMWGMTYTMNDISYWSMLPSLTVNPKERERVTSLARIGANVGLFLVTALVPVLTQLGDMRGMYRTIAVAVAALFICCQILVVVGVQERPNDVTGQQNEKHTRLRDMIRIIGRNDQLLAIVCSMFVFNVGYFVTTGFGVQFFYFDYGVYGGMEFTIFAICIGIAQVTTLALYPLLTKNLARRQVFRLAILLVLLGYLGFMATGYLLPMNMIVLCIIGLVLFSGQAMIQLLCYVLLADTIEYGQWKLGTRNESVIFSLNPFITKLASAVQAGVFALTLAVSGLNRYSGQISQLEKSTTLTTAQIKQQCSAVVASIPRSATLQMRAAMLVLPLVLIVASYFIYRRFYRIDDGLYAKIIADLEQRSRTKEN